MSWQAYQALLGQYGQEEVGELTKTKTQEFEDEMEAFAYDTIAALDIAVDAYDYAKKEGFNKLPNLLEDYVANYIFEVTKSNDKDRNLWIVIDGK